MSILAPEPKGIGHVTDRLTAKSVFLNLEVADQQTHRGLEEWQKVRPNRSNLLLRVDNRKILFMVGCGEKPEEELQKTSEIPDVTLEELNTDAQMIAGRLIESGVPESDFEVIKVYLGSADTPRVDPETSRQDTNDREIAKKAGIDIYIDTWRAYLWGIKEELKRLGIEQNGIRLVTSVPEYRLLFEELAKALDIKLYSKGEDPGNATLVAYERISDETVHRAIQLKTEYKDRKVIALTSNVEDDKVAKKEKIDSICSAIVIKNLIKAVRQLLKEGKSASEIQQLIDELIGKPLDIQSINS